MNVRTVLKNTSGFTLLELLVVLAIAGLLMSVVPPIVAAAVPGVRLKSQAVDFAATLRYARNRAVSLGREVDVVVDTRTPAYTLAGGQEQTLSADIDLAIWEYHSMIPAGALRADGLSGDESTLRFYPDGSTSGAVISMRLDGAAYLIEMGWLIGTVSVSPGMIDDD